MMKRLVPKVFYDRLDDALDLFVDCLGFTVLYRDQTLAVAERDGAKACLVENPEFAAKDRPELAIETDSITELYDEIVASVRHVDADVSVCGPVFAKVAICFTRCAQPLRKEDDGDGFAAIFCGIVDLHRDRPSPA